ncbi:protein FAM13A-like isoform X4 [Leptidea sinapis]|uniref:protein FAM13A-like isoform X4 n=1 Tax=Leptidea sinapis TaxID=189913 RepID=UPI0021C363F7|nr:protein FAM13A-like isoform X4 [Leptidea sinapis]
MVVVGRYQGVGTPSDCSSDRPIVLSGNGWPAQNCEQERERETENMAAPECEREVRKRRERRDSGCAHERKERRPHSEERLPPPPPPPLQDYNRLESERRAERLSRARRPQFGKRRRTPARLPRQPKENDHLTAEESRCGTPPNFEYVIQQKPEVSEEPERSQSCRRDEAECTRRDERSVPARLTQASPDRRLEKINKKWIEGARHLGGRSNIPEANWTSAQLAAEKCCVQRALLRLEAARGRPAANSAERGAARHLYERYRAVKRTLASRSDNLLGANGELATIHEHEAMLFNSSVDSSSDSQEKPSDSSQETPKEPLQSPPTRETVEEVPSSTSSAKSATSEETPTNEGLHYLALEDLVRALAEAKMTKCILRRSIKEYESNFEMQNSRKVQRDDKKGKEEDYQKYKGLKARIKLLNALINKQKALQSF